MSIFYKWITASVAGPDMISSHLFIWLIGYRLLLQSVRIVSFFICVSFKLRTCHKHYIFHRPPFHPVPLVQVPANSTKLTLELPNEQHVLHLEFAHACLKATVENKHLSSLSSVLNDCIFLLLLSSSMLRRNMSIMPTYVFRRRSAKYIDFEWVLYCQKKKKY